jgi:hypothetical protein
LIVHVFVYVMYLKSIASPPSCAPHPPVFIALPQTDVARYGEAKWFRSSTLQSPPCRPWSPSPGFSRDLSAIR